MTLCPGSIGSPVEEYSFRAAADELDGLGSDVNVGIERISKLVHSP